ncbi:interleukin-13 receptor subunit alpha-1-like isoform X2 [Osmerus mordax]|uniref:interleukin-13 receptor subunit alpha-1-like isoform X1 n=1 Tax=Osmerus mordax TaxID=8014 RepID=UPI00351065DB
MLFEYFGIVGILLCFILVTESGTDKVPLPAPRNLSISWRDEFCLTLSWQAPQEDLGKCKVKYYVRIDELEYRYDDLGPYKRIETSPKCHFTENTVKYTVQTEPIACGDRNRSEPVTQIIPQRTVLQHIKDFNCYLYSTKDMNCSWLTSNHVSDLQLLYRRDEDTHLAACTKYLYRNGVKTGCHLHDNQAFEWPSVYFLLNGTFDGSPFQNTFKRTPRKLVKPPPPTLNIKQEGKKLVLDWVPPDIFQPDCWEYKLKYIKCGETSSVTSQTNSASIPYDSMCQYKIQLETTLKSLCILVGGSSIIVRSPFQVYGQDNHNMIVVAIIVPIIIFVSVIIALVSLRKHKTIIFPDIPKPQLIFKDIMNNNKEPKNPIEKLYVPVPEEVYIPVPENVK